MANPDERRRMASAIFEFEARRHKGLLVVYKLPPSDGGGTYEVAGINDRYDKEVVDALVRLIDQNRQAEAETLAITYIAETTDRAASWTRIPGLEFYLRDMIFNRGANGTVRIVQDALDISVDGLMGPNTLGALAAAEATAAQFLLKLRAAREAYERIKIGRDESNELWRGLVNRWNNALATARTFSLEPVTGQAQAAPSAPAAPAAAPSPAVVKLEAARSAVLLPALRVGGTGDRVTAWQQFLRGEGLDPGPADGQFGEHTRDATRAFQEKYGLGTDGVAGRVTLLKAADQGLELFEEPADDQTSSNFPPRPSFEPLSDAGRAAIFSTFNYVPAPTADNPEAISILGTWEEDNIVKVSIPQLRTALGGKAPQSMRVHKLASPQIQALWAAWESAGLLKRVLTYDGAFVARFIRGSRTKLSNHSFGTAFDINYEWNKLGHRPALVGQQGSVRELVAIANAHGLYWGGHFETRPDGMHFEIAFVKS